MISGQGILFANFRPPPGSALADSHSSTTATTYASPSRSFNASDNNKDLSYSHVSPSSPWQNSQSQNRSQSRFEDEGSPILDPSFLRERNLYQNTGGSLNGSPSPIKNGFPGDWKGKGKLRLEELETPTKPQRNSSSLSRVTFDAGINSSMSLSELGSSSPKPDLFSSTAATADSSPSHSTFSTPFQSRSTKSNLLSSTAATVNSSPSQSAFSTPSQSQSTFFTPAKHSKFFSSSTFPPPSPSSGMGMGMGMSPHAGKRDLSNLGYFAFPPQQPPNTTENGEATAMDTGDTNTNNDMSSKPVTTTTAPVTPTPAQLERMAREKAEAQRGEEEWVRSGGVLRDKDGNRDLERTEKVKEELRIRDWEEEVLKRWEAYEKAWGELMKAINVGNQEVRFTDIPWPVSKAFDTAMKSSMPSRTKAKAGIHGPPKAVETVTLGDLIPAAIEAFFLDPLKIRGNTTATKDRIRTSLLRWHPDKLMGLVSRVKEEDVEDVTEGIGIVTRRLREM